VLIGLLALSWALASNHCKLEQIPGLAFLACCQHEEASVPHQDDNCQTDGCASFENQLYKTENAQHFLDEPTFHFSPYLNPLPGELSSSQAGRRVLPAAAPLELARFWQFSYRTALPPRAPSFLS
jgi:hypothetical protein